MPGRDRFIGQSLGASLTKRVKDSRVLLVGAGGIGCEVLKNLVCCSFGSGSTPAKDSSTSETESNELNTSNDRKPEIVVIDLDTIDLSNLNRQFLFRKQHIKKPKAFVAKETASQFNPSVSIDAHHASIFDKQYSVDFFESFDLVFNALDNLAARRHVNRMCLAANVPLIESGTTGFAGQVQAIQRGVTECYDCNSKPVQKSFPICTIRSTPSQPIHCIVWAKSYLFPELFGTSEEDASDVVVTEGDNAEEVAKLKEEAEALKNIRGLLGKDEFAQEVFNKVFHDDIERLRSMSEMWQSRQPPTSLKFEELKGEQGEIESQGSAISLQDQGIWSIRENLAVFCHSLSVLSKRVQSGENVIEFDKDDKDTLDFVASAANLRSHIFGINLHSEWEIKQMAGNIIPAIATSNALTASLCVLEAFKIMRGSQTYTNGALAPSSASNAHTNGHHDDLMGGARMVFLQSHNTERMVATQRLVGPNPECPVCSPVYAKLALQEGSLPTLGQLVDLLKEKLGYDEFSITTDAGIIFDPDLDDNLEKSLAEMGIEANGNGFIRVADDADEPKADLALSVSSQKGTSQETPAMQLLPTDITLPLKPIKAPVKDDATAMPGTKRKREPEEQIDAVFKKAKLGEQEVLVIEDDGAILLDD
ncbi:Hypothetical protein R9X50_00751900 [Acrodontium crateriforme]|uniref:Ubiquitin-activating enzyme E1-like n=1 Tax=Acrodontium crateriforme TaxID=150365 RepID=A0AAQ3R7R6_9PEZI|nr:Hypothetical protein R9X50_00751900 [Acrodontium crateriforme]